MSLAGAAARGAGVSLVGQWGRFIIQLVSTAILARILAPGDFGVLAMVMAIAGLATLLSDFGLSMAAMQSTSATSAQRSNLFWLNTLFGLISALLVFAFSGAIATLYGDDRLIAVAQAIAVIFVLQSVVAQFRAESARQLRYTWLAVSDVTAQAMALIVAIAVALGGGSYWALVAQQITVAAVQLIVVSSTARWWPGVPRRHQNMGSLISFGMNAGGVQLINYLSSNVDTILLGRYWGSATVGVYNQAYQFFRVPLQQLAAPMTRVAVPVLSRLSDISEYQRYVGRAQLVLTYLLGGAFMLSASVSVPLMGLLLGPGWEEAPYIYSILAIGGVFQALGYVYYWIFLSKNLTGIQLRFALISRSLMVGLIAVGVLGGAYGVAAASSVGLALNWLILTIFAVPKSGVDVRRLVGTAIRPICAYLPALVVVYPLGVITSGALPDVAQLIVLLVAIMVILLLVYAVAPPVRVDVKLVIATIQRVRKK